MLGARGGPAALQRLHRKAAQHEPLHEVMQRRAAPLPDRRRVVQRGGQAVLHDVPGARVDRFDPQRIRQHPVRARDNFGEEVRVAGGRHVLRSTAQHRQVGHDRARRGAGEGLFGALVGDRRAVCRVAVHRCGRRHDCIGPVQPVRSQFDQIIDRPGPHGNRHRVRMARQRRRHAVHVAHFGIEAVILKQHMRRAQQRRHLCAGGLPRSRVGHHDGRPAPRKLFSHDRRHLGQHTFPNDTCARIARMRQSLVQSSTHATVLPSPVPNTAKCFITHGQTNMMYI